MFKFIQKLFGVSSMCAVASPLAETIPADWKGGNFVMSEHGKQATAKRMLDAEKALMDTVGYSEPGYNFVSKSTGEVGIILPKREVHPQPAAHDSMFAMAADYKRRPYAVSEMVTPKRPQVVDTCSSVDYGKLMHQF